ncbi:ABC transporter permease [Microbulbifer taiwanensis]|uniref:ABC transporter permease n=1 Tax=Microbulbifer taiwanensis TaxID=986746 RepID=UPI00360A4EC4
MGLGTVFLSHYRRHPGQLAGLLLILVCAAMLWSGVRSLTAAAENAVAESRAALEPLLSVVHVDGRALEVEDFVRLRRAGLCVSPRLEVRFAGSEIPAVIGIDPFSADCLRQYSRQPEERAPVASQLLAGFDRPTLLGSATDLARWRQLSLPGGGDYQFEEFDGLPRGQLLTDISVAAELASAGRSRLEILLPAAEAERLPLPEGYRGQVEDYGVEPEPLVEAFLLSLDALGALALLVAALLVRSVYRFALEQRRRSLEILVRLGVRPVQLRLALVVEVLLVALVGGTLGLWLGERLASAMADGFQGTLQGLFSVDILARGAPSAETWLGMVLILALVVGWACADLLMLRREREGREPMVRWRWLGALLLVTVSLLVLLLTGRLWLIFLATLGCLIGAGLLLPELLNRLLARAERHCRQPLLEWSCSEMRALCRLLSLPLTALAFAIATAIGVQAMVTGFESTFARWLDQRLQGDLYLDPGRPLDSAEWSERLRGLPGVTTVLPMVRGRALLDGLQVDVLAIDPASPLLRDWPFLDAVPNHWVALPTRGVLINEQLARRQSLAVGDRIRFHFGGASVTPNRHSRAGGNPESPQPLDPRLRGGDETRISNGAQELHTREVIGIYADYGRPEGELMLPLAIVPDALPDRYATFVLGVEDIDKISWRDWRSEYPWLAGSRLRDQAGLKRGPTPPLPVPSR